MDYKGCKKEVDEIISQYISNNNYDNRIKDNLKYILEDGKRLRSTITLAVLEKMQPERWEKMKEICLIPEFIHTASLVIDDLPAFDNALTRRGKECIHIKRGEGIAYIVSLTLLTESMLIANKELQVFKREYGKEEGYNYYEEYMESIIRNISANGAIGGQLLSTYHFGEGNMKMDKMTKEEISEVMYKKTSTFFEIAFMSGWIAGRGDLEKIDKIKEISKLMGLCYQIYDDFEDYAEDIEHFSHNYVYHRGIDIAYSEFLEYHQQLDNIIHELGIGCMVLEYVLNMMKEKVLEAKNRMIV